MKYILKSDRTGDHLENQTEKDTERSIVALLKAL